MIFEIPVNIERSELLSVEAPTLEEALHLVEEATNQQISEEYMQGYREGISANSYVEIDWSVLDKEQDEV